MDDVGLPFQPPQHPLRSFCVGARVQQVVPADHFAADEATRDIRTAPGLVDRLAGEPQVEALDEVGDARGIHLEAEPL